MELTKIESAYVESAVEQAAAAQLCELNDLQLAFIGGGQGEVVAV